MGLMQQENNLQSIIVSIKNKNKIPKNLISIIKLIIYYFYAIS